MAIDLTLFGGTPIPILQNPITPLIGAPPAENAGVGFNFGVVAQDETTKTIIQATPSLYQAFPNIAGTWDKKTSINHIQTALKVLGSETEVEKLVQYQPNGTCGGRAGSACDDFVQLLMIAQGKRAKFKRVSHAYIYWAARETGGMNRPRSGDGVPSGSVPDALASRGQVTREEAGDLSYYGRGSDDLAVKWGSGGMSADLKAKLDGLAADNVIKSWAPVKSAQEGADGIASGGILIGSDSQGFTMTRDKDGCCGPSGRWDHYQIRPGILVLPNGRIVFVYWQSWSLDTPSGPKLVGCPGNCFGVDFDVMDHVIKSGDWAVLYGFEPFELEAGPILPPWSVVN